jgi:predicted DNA-binding protein (UPF0251 family)
MKTGPEPTHPDPQVAANIAALVAGGKKQLEIAAILGISTKTLHQHYKVALQIGKEKVDAMAIGNLVDLLNKKDWNATRFYLERRVEGFSNKLTVKPANPLEGAEREQVELVDQMLEAADLDELEMLDALIAKIGARQPGADEDEDRALTAN